MPAFAATGGFRRKLGPFRFVQAPNFVTAYQFRIYPQKNTRINKTAKFVQQFNIFFML